MMVEIKTVSLSHWGLFAQEQLADAAEQLSYRVLMGQRLEARGTYRPFTFKEFADAQHE